MEIAEEQKRRKEFKKILREMATKQAVFKNPTKLQSVCNKLKYVYKGESSDINFRHYYSDIFSTLTDIKNEGNEIDVVGQNLGLVYEYCLKNAEEDLCNSVRKLLDHTNLEISRINYVNVIDTRIDITGEDFQNRISSINFQVDEADKKVEEVKNKVNNSYSDYVSILGIFSGIVLVFFGGTSIFGNIISNMQKTSVDKSVLICSITGIVIFDIIFMFIYFLAKLLNRDISATKYHVEYLPIVSRFKNRYPFVYYTNGILTLTALISSVILVIRKILNCEINDKKFGDMLIELLVKNNYKWLAIFSMFICINFIFSVAYIISKIKNINIGMTISLRYGKYLYWMGEEDGKHAVYSGNKKIKEFDTYEKADNYISRKWRRSDFSARVCNFCKRVFIRYPYMTIINLIFMFLIIYNM